MCATQVSREQTRVEWHINPPDVLRNLIDEDCIPPMLI